MKERLKQLRKELGLTQQQFSDRIGVNRATLATYEMGRNDPSNAVITLICREFNVREEWLRTGEGEMFNPEPQSNYEVLKGAYPHLIPEMFALADEILKLPEAQQKAVMDFFHKAAKRVQEIAPAKEPSREELHQMLDEQLDLEKEEETSGVS